MKEEVSCKRKSPFETNPHKSPMDLNYNRKLIEGDNTPIIEIEPPSSVVNNSSKVSEFEENDAMKNDSLSDPPEFPENSEKKSTDSSLDEESGKDE